MESISKTPENLTPDHLKSSDLQIIACLDSIENKTPPEINDWDKVDVIDLYMSQDDAQKQNFTKSENIAFVISDINDHDKISSKYKNCTGVILSGIDKHTQEPISLLTHQNPGYIFYGDEDSFKDALKKKISDFKLRCEDKSIDAVIFGGQLLKFKDLPNTNPAQKMLTEEYGNSIKFISELLEIELGFTPTVVTGPKTEPGIDIVLYQNNTRRLFLYRNKNAGNFTNSFSASSVDENIPNWSPGEISIEEYLGKNKD